MKHPISEIIFPCPTGCVCAVLGVNGIHIRQPSDPAQRESETKVSDEICDQLNCYSYPAEWFQVICGARRACIDMPSGVGVARDPEEG